MGVVAAMVGKDLRRRVRSPLGMLAALAFPLIFASLLALTFGGGGEAAPKLRLLVENRDDGLLGDFLVSALGSEEAAERLDVEPVGGEEPLGLEEVSRLLEKTGAAALLRVPEGFTDAVLHGEPATLTLLRNPAQGILPEVAEQLAGLLAEGLDAASRALRRPLDLVAGMMDREEAPDDTDLIATTLAVRGVIEEAEELIFPPAITLETVTRREEPEEESGPSGIAGLFVLVLPGVSLYALFLIGDLSMRDLLVEARLGTLTRQLAGPVRPATLLAAKVVTTLVLATLGVGLLALVGAAFIRQPVDPPGFVALSLAAVLAVTGTGATLYGAVGNERRGAVVGSIVFLVFAFAGGAFGGLQVLPEAVVRVAPLSPFYWGVDGFETLLARGGGLADVAPHVAVLAGLGAVLLALGAVLLRRRVARGVTA